MYHTFFLKNLKYEGRKKQACLSSWTSLLVFFPLFFFFFLLNFSLLYIFHFFPVFCYCSILVLRFILFFRFFFSCLLFCFFRFSFLYLFFCYFFPLFFLLRFKKKNVIICLASARNKSHMIFVLYPQTRSIGACELVAESMGVFPTKIDVQHAACVAVGNLANRHAENKRRLGAAGACNKVWTTFR